MKEILRLIMTEISAFSVFSYYSKWCFILSWKIFYMAICIVSEKERGRFSKQGCYQKSVGIALIDRCLFHYFKLLNQLDNSSTIYALERDNLLTVGKKNRNLMRTEVFPSGIKQGYSVNKMLFVSAFVFSSRTKKKPKTKKPKQQFFYHDLYYQSKT